MKKDETTLATGYWRLARWKEKKKCEKAKTGVSSLPARMYFRIKRNRKKRERGCGDSREIYLDIELYTHINLSLEAERRIFLAVQEFVFFYIVFLKHVLKRGMKILLSRNSRVCVINFKLKTNSDSRRLRYYNIVDINTRANNTWLSLSNCLIDH